MIAKFLVEGVLMVSGENIFVAKKVGLWRKHNPTSCFI